MNFARIDVRWVLATTFISVVSFTFLGCSQTGEQTANESPTEPAQLPAADHLADGLAADGSFFDEEMEGSVLEESVVSSGGDGDFGAEVSTSISNPAERSNNGRVRARLEGESESARRHSNSSVSTTPQPPKQEAQADRLELPGGKDMPAGNRPASAVAASTEEERAKNPAREALPQQIRDLGQMQLKGSDLPLNRPDSQPSSPGSESLDERQEELAKKSLSRKLGSRGAGERRGGQQGTSDNSRSPKTSNNFGRSGVALDYEVPALVASKKKALQLDLQPGEELWIIARATDTKAANPNPEVPGCGALMATLPNQPEQVPVPLKHTAVEGNIDGYIATVDVTQQFHNPYDSKIEAVYVFPLPQNAAVNEFVMTVGDRKIRGIIREREKAEQIYAAAKSQGHVAALMTQERPNIFTQKVANIEPGKKIDINIRYFNTLRYDDGAYEFVFPMVVGPRFNPPAMTAGVGAVARGGQGASGQKTEVQYLAPHERSGHDISLSLNIAAGVDVENVHCVNHAVNVQEICESQRRVTLSSRGSIPNRDFVLRYKVAGDQIKTAMLTHEDDHGKYFTMMLYPPADLAQVQRSPMEMVFVLDCSGSMRGKPIAQAKAAISYALQSLTPRDSFQIIRFSNNASQLGPEPVLATEANIQRGLKYVASLNGTGGTHMIEGIRTALDFPHDEGRFRVVSFMTDGYIGNEQQIMSTIHDKVGASRIFSFGVGSSPNRFLMDRMAIIGRGAVAYLSLNDDATAIMERFHQSISHPAMTDLSIDFGSMDVSNVYPQRLPDLIVGRPVVITGRFRGELDTVSVTGRVDMEATSFTVSLDEEDASTDHRGVAAVWARLKIKDMVNYASHAPEVAAEIREAVTDTALAYNLMSSFTAFVAVDSLTKN